MRYSILLTYKIGNILMKKLQIIHWILLIYKFCVILRIIYSILDEIFVEFCKFYDVIPYMCTFYKCTWQKSRSQLCADIKNSQYVQNELGCRNFTAFYALFVFICTNNR